MPQIAKMNDLPMLRKMLAAGNAQANRLLKMDLEENSEYTMKALNDKYAFVASALIQVKFRIGELIANS